MAQANNPFWNCSCGCMSKPDVAKFAESLDAVGGKQSKIAFTSTVAIPSRPGDRDALYEWKTEPLPLEATHAEARVFDLGSRPRGTPPIDMVIATHTITESSFSIVTLLRHVPSELRRDEIDAIVQDITERFELMLRTALWGGQSK